jgi:hypothetical protein
MAGLITAGALIGAGALYKGITGAVQNHQASQIEKNNIRPTEYVDPAYQQNVNTAQNMSQQGIPQASYNNQENAINQNQGAAISSLNNSANPGANLASIVRAGDNATGNLNAQDAIARNKNTLLLMQQKGLLAGAKQRAWDYNYADKYSEQLAKSQALRGAGMQNQAGAASALIGAGTQIAGNRVGKVPNTYTDTGGNYGMGGDE